MSWTRCRKELNFRCRKELNLKVSKVWYEKKINEKEANVEYKTKKKSLAGLCRLLSNGGSNTCYCGDVLYRAKYVKGLPKEMIGTGWNHSEQK